MSSGNSSGKHNSHSCFQLIDSKFAFNESKSVRLKSKHLNDTSLKSGGDGVLGLHGLYDSIMSAMRWSDMAVSHVDTWLMRLGEFERQRSRILSFRVGSKMYWLRRWSATKSKKVSMHRMVMLVAPGIIERVFQSMHGKLKSPRRQRS